MTVKRYRFWLDPMADCHCSVEDDPTSGGYVEFADYEWLRGLLRDCRALTYGGYSEGHLLDMRGRIDAALAGEKP